MRDPPRSREWQDYYDNQKTYIPPSYPTTTSRYSRAHSPPTSPRRSSSGYTAAREQGNRWNLFEGMTIYIHPRENETSHEVRRRLNLMDKIKYHGGSLSVKPNASYVTTVLIHLPQTYPRHTVLLIDRPREIPNIGEWTRDELVQHLAKVSTTEDSPVYQYGRKRVLRIDWAEECLRDGRLRGENESWGGWEVRATYDPKLVNDHSSYQTLSADYGFNEYLSQQEDDRLEARFQLSPESYTSPAEHVETLAQDPRKYLRAKADQLKGGVVGDRENIIGSITDERGHSQEEANTYETQEEASISIEEPMPEYDTDATDLSGSRDSQRDRSLQIEDIHIDEIRANNGEKVEQSQAHGLVEPEGVHTINTVQESRGSGQGIIVDIHVKEDIRKQVYGDKEVTSTDVEDETERVEVKPEDGDSIIRPGGSKIEETEDGTEGNDNRPKESQNEVGDNENKKEDQDDGSTDTKPVIMDNDEEPSKDDIGQNSLRSQSQSRSIRSRSSSSRYSLSQGSHNQSTRSSASEAPTANAVSAATRVPSSPTASQFFAVPRVEQRVFTRGVLLPHTFCVLGEGREKRFTERIITSGEGIIASSGSAIFLIVLLSPEQNASLADHPEVCRMVRKIQSEPGRRAVSVDWVEDCIERNTLLPLEGYVMAAVEDRSAEPISPPPSGSGSSDSGSKKRDGGARDGREGSKKKSRT
ncbi:hypothetical protein I203_103220 [Kwoniella mangroviensis CBS 8507]|uniref:uncharacterized protein n=1 Tax=Kwoniella mangroviensis CBS 8507 TaxID=1296122 RepID=UPI00080CBFA5|nr:uncharacterized protein I203_07406 [Kwoniella mangroviensis CBS 8507]OCF63342.1 hypothetical protein I203_07406 [Kwoniella mangroviensis CBS 8507]